MRGIKPIFPSTDNLYIGARNFNKFNNNFFLSNNVIYKTLHLYTYI